MPSIAVGLSKDLANGRVMRAFAGEQDLVIWRSKSGKLSAWDNRCPHRGMRLSHGFVRGEALAFFYHGWHYDKTATCRYIPAHPELEPPATIKANDFLSAEAGGLIWVNVEGETDEPLVPEDLLPIRSINFRCTPNILQDAIKEAEFNILNQSNDMWQLELPDMDVQLHLFLQQLPNQQCTVHALSSGDGAASTKKQISSVLENLRRLAETKHGEFAS